jgi:Tfp pilus assembly protein PilO
VLKRIKLTKMAWLLLAAGVVVVAFSSLGVAYFQQVDEKNQLDEDLDLANRKLNTLQLQELRSQQQELEQQLSEMISQLETAKAELSPSIENIAATDTVLETANDSDVVVNEYASADFNRGDLTGITFSILPITATIKGNVPDIIDFVINLNGNFTTGVVQTVNILASDNITGVDSAAATIKQSIYVYQGD